MPDRDSALSCFLLVELLVACVRDSSSPQRPEIDASTVSCWLSMPGCIDTV